MSDRNIFLVGYRCTGKTSVGKFLAEDLGFRFVDADAMLVEAAGKTIADVVAEGGWPLFRQLEKETLRRICSETRQVVATGGGVILDPDNIAVMKENGIVIWLKAPADIICERMPQDPATTASRPPLTDKDLMAEIRETLAQRMPLYQGAMHFSVDTEEKPVSIISREISALLRQAQTPL